MGDAVYMPAPVAPEVVLARPPTSEQQAREMYRLHAEWQAVCWTAHGERDSGYIELQGGVYRTRYERGKRKGQLNYSKPEPGTAATVSVTRAARDEWIARWEEETGFCSECSGTGWALHGWDHKKGNCYRPCTRCNATGRAPRIAREHLAIDALL